MAEADATMSAMNALRMLLISSDLMASSRLAGAVQSVGATLETLAGAAGVPRGEAFDLVLLDLQSLPADPASLVARARELGGPTARVVAFGPHVWKDRLDAAVAAGADEAVSRGEVMGDVAAVIRRWARS